MSHEVFICYDERDRDIADAIYNIFDNYYNYIDFLGDLLC